ncbi:MAG: protein-disulfide reductase DsbD [Pseudomonadota bacterium]
MRFILTLLLCLAFTPPNNSYAENFWEKLPLIGSKQPTFLQPDKAFGLEISVGDPNTLVASFRVTPDYYLYRDKVVFTPSGAAAQAAGLKVVNVAMPRGDIKQDPNFGATAVFHDAFDAVITLQRNDGPSQSVTLEAVYQGCSEKGLCYPPITKLITVELPAKIQAQPAATAVALTSSEITTAPATMAAADSPVAGLSAAEDNSTNENTRIARLFKQGDFWLITLFFLGAGLLLAFTPCMFPMVPILSGIIVGRGHHLTKMHGFILSLAYVMGMALTYAAVGVAAGFSGTLLSSALQTPWVLGSFAGVFVLLSLSMFGFYELQLPTALQSKLSSTSNRLHGGHLGGVFLMGILSAVIVGPCVAAPLAGALLYIGQTHDAVLGATALFAMGLGMGLPLLVIGASAGALLPRAGAWMESVKRFFGVMLLGVAIWLISSLIPVSVQMLLWAALLVLSSIYLRALDALPPNAKGWHRLWKGVGIMALLLGIAYLVGALSGARDVQRPLGALGGAQAKAVSLQFVPIRNAAELDKQIAQAAGKTVMLDFYADWCVSCKEMERDTFSDAKVQARLKNTVILQADVTANNADDQTLLQRYSLFGPPAILFFNAQGREQNDHRVTGYQNAEQFLKSLSAANL